MVIFSIIYIICVIKRFLLAETDKVVSEYVLRLVYLKQMYSIFLVSVII